MKAGGKAVVKRADESDEAAIYRQEAEGRCKVWRTGRTMRTSVRGTRGGRDDGDNGEGMEERVRVRVVCLKRHGVRCDTDDRS
jgi:hypothetical protein